MLRACVALWVLILPAPVINTRIGQGALCFPAQLLFGSAGVGVADIAITWPAFDNTMGDVAVSCTF